MMCNGKKQSAMVRNNVQQQEQYATARNTKQWPDTLSDGKKQYVMAIENYVSVLYQKQSQKPLETVSKFQNFLGEHAPRPPSLGMLMHLTDQPPSLKSWLSLCHSCLQPSNSKL